MADKEKTTTTNPADRLLEIVEKAKGVQAPRINHGFLKVFEITDSGYLELYRRLSAVSQQALFISYLLRISGYADAIV
jgi:hypothetical protein